MVDYLEYSKLNSKDKKTTDPIIKLARNMERHFNAVGSQMENMHMTGAQHH